MTLSALRSFLKANPQFRVVIVDTLQRMLSIEDLNDYAQAVDNLSRLKAIADDLKIAIVAIHHTRKGGNKDTDHMESALGSTGINATADCTLTMLRQRGASEVTLSVTGRDVEDTRYSLSWNPELCSFSITEQGPLKPVLTEAKQQIIDLLESEKRNWTTGEITEKLGKSNSTISEHLGELFKFRLIDRPKTGNWCIKGGFGDSAPLKETEPPKVEENAGTPPGLLFPNKTTETDTAA
jgi:DNA-binding transcriptional ArsR family regulator